MKRKRMRLLQGAACAASVFICGSAWAKDDTEKSELLRASWPAFHGVDRLNMSPETGLLKRWPAGGPPLLWTYDGCGRGYSGVSLAEGRIFTAGDFDDAEEIIALDLEGKLLWKTPNGAPWTRSSPGARSTPTWDEGRVYHMNPLGRLACFDAGDGRELWAVDLKERFDARWGIWALSENVLVDGDLVLCMPGGPRGRVVALDKHTGNTVWANTEIEDMAAYCSPVIVTHDGVRQLLTMTQKSVVGVEVATGRLVWSAPFVPRSPQNALTPLFHDGQVFVACGHSSGGALLKIDQPSRSAATVWYREDLDNCHSGTLLIDGRIFGTACRMGGKHFYSVDFSTGETVKLDESLGKVGLTYAEGMIYCLNHQGEVSLLKVTPDGFETVSQFSLPRKAPNHYLAHPVVCGGRLYLRGGEMLYGFDIRERR